MVCVLQWDCCNCVGCAKRVDARLVDFATALMDSFLCLPDGQLRVLGDLEGGGGGRIFGL